MAHRRAKASVLAVGVLLLSIAAMSCRSAEAQSAAEFYRGKTVSLYVGYPAGGAYDVYARLIARFLPKYMPGNPNVIIRNQPGAASLTFVNELYAVMPQDGTAFGTFARSVAIDRLLGRPGTNFDPEKLNWVGSANNEVSICVVWHGLNITSSEDFLSRPIVFGANAPGSESDVNARILNNLLGAKFRVITGYPGTNDLMMAMERGETQGRCGMTWSALKAALPDWITGKKVYIALQFATHRHPELPDVPLVTDLAHNDLERAALQLVLAGQAMGRPFAAPPNVPPERLEALRRAFDGVMADPDFFLEASKQGLEVQPVSGEDIQRLVAAMFRAPPGIVEAARRAISAN
ncbi:MAG: tripartite tricarboxylate transporter family receptor [Hyphomicrobiales bacterium]|nr:tripartite tricarboxylate transporter family receptor [Hyphomicrobiales bacterium]